VPQGILTEPAVGIQYDNDVGRIETQVPHTELQRIAFATACGIGANYHVDPCRMDYRGGIIRTIIGDHEDAVIRSDLCLNVAECGKYSRPLIMSGNKDGRPVGQRA
jgi:hypothetical protein